MGLVYLDARYKWVTHSGDGTAHAPHIRKSPLVGNVAKALLVQVQKGDLTAPNPRSTQLVRAGGNADVTTFYRNDLAYSFFIFRKLDEVLIGALTLANIRRGCAQAGSLGYWIGAAYARQGHMTAAVNAIVPFAFDTLKLHRIEAACIPANVASVRLLEKTGFKREGFARQYLCINGIWQDHWLYARLKDDQKS